MTDDFGTSEKKIFILPNNLSKTYLQDLKKAALRNKFKIEEKFE